MTARHDRHSQKDETLHYEDTGGAMITTTLNAIKARHPDEDEWKKLLDYLGKTEADDEPLPFLVILDSNGLECTLRMARAAPEHIKLWRMMAVFCARDVLKFTDDWRVVQAVQIAERYAHGMASKDQLKNARAASRAAAWAAAGYGASNAAWAAWSAANAASWAAWDVSCTAWSAAKAARIASPYGADAANARQEEYFRRLVG